MKHRRPRHQPILMIVLALVGSSCVGVGALTVIRAHADPAPPLPVGTYCQGPQPSQPVTGPTHVLNIVLENESAVTVDASPDAPFENGTLNSQCGTFGQGAMHSTAHGSESNYFALVSGLNPTIMTGNDAQANFGLSDCPPSATLQPPSSSCSHGSGHIAPTTPSIYSLVEQQYGVAGWKSYSDDMPSNCLGADANIYATDSDGKGYPLYVTRHNPAIYFFGPSCATQDVPSGDWRHAQGALYTDLVSGTMPYYSFIEPNDIENGHDPVSVKGANGVTTTIAGGTSQIGNIDSYLSTLMPIVQQSPQYQDGSLVVLITYDEGAAKGSAPGEGSVGEQCADPAISPQALSCQIKTWVVGRYVTNASFNGFANHFTLVAAMQRLLGLPPLLAHAGDAATADIVNGTAASPDPFNLAATVATPTAPSAPTGVIATAGDTSASVTFAAPFATGGAPITSYTVTATPDGATASGSTSPIQMTGLTNNTAYTFTVTATNSAGTSDQSVASAPVTPASAPLPAAPTALTATPGDGQVTLSWHAPPAVVGAPVTDYIVQYALSGTGTFTTIDESSTATTAVVAGLTNNMSYDFQVSAVNSGGQGPPSAITTATPSAQLLPDPGFEAGNGGWVAFKIGTLSRIAAPVHGGTSALQVTSPSASASLVGLTQNAAVSNSVAGRTYVASCWVRPTTSSLNLHFRLLEYTQNFGSSITLQDNVTAALPVGVWTFVQVPGVAAKSGERMIPQIYSTTQTSANGAMLYDDCSLTASSSTGPPSAPTAVTATAGNGSATVSFTAPSANGSPISGYTVTSTPGNIIATGTASPITVAGLVNGTTYTFTVTATNASGPGPASTASNAVTPATTPSAPLSVTATAADAAASVAFAPPASNGGAPITGYTVVASPGGASTTGSASPIVVNGLTNGTTYTFVVTATNSAGPGAASAPSNAVTPSAQLLPDPGFESGNGGWIAFNVGTLSRVAAPVHGGAFALKVAGVSTSSSLVGLTQNTAVSNSVAGKTYTASCFVQPTAANLNVQIRILEYTQNFSSSTRFQGPVIASLPVNTWTLLQVSAVAARSGERMIPQIYSGNETTKTGSLVYDDCSLTAG